MTAEQRRVNDITEDGVMGMERSDQGGKRDKGTNRVEDSQGQSRMEGIVEGKTEWKARPRAWNGMSGQGRAEKGNIGQDEA